MLIMLAAVAVQGSQVAPVWLRLRLRRSGTPCGGMAEDKVEATRVA